MKKITAFLLAVFMVILNFCGCSVEEKPKTLEASMELPENGIISAEILDELKKENGIITFFSESGDIHYEWTVFGSDIKTPCDINFKVNIEEISDSEIGLSLLFDESLDFAPVLSLYLSQSWSGDSAVVYKGSGDSKAAFSSAAVSGSNSPVLSFSVSESGTFTIEAEKIEEVYNAELENSTEAETPEKSKEPISGEIYTVPDESDLYTTVSANTGKALSDGSQTGKDSYQTDPVPEGKPLPVEPEEQNIDHNKTFTCKFSIECSTILNNLSTLDAEKLDALPSNGIILSTRTVEFYEGESVYDVLQRVCSDNGIHMEASFTPIYNSSYIEGIHNLYEFDCGSGSGWMYRVNGWYPNYGCSRYVLSDGDIVEWRYTCDLGADIGGANAIG